MHKAPLAYANLVDADLREVNLLEPWQLSDTIGNDQTQLPDNIEQRPMMWSYSEEDHIAYGKGSD